MMCRWVYNTHTVDMGPDLVSRGNCVVGLMDFVGVYLVKLVFVVVVVGGWSLVADNCGLMSAGNWCEA